MTRRDALRFLAAVPALKLCAQEAPVGEKAASTDPSPVEFEVQSKGLQLGLTSYGHIIRLALGEASVRIPFHACTVLAGCRAGKFSSKRLADRNGIEITRTYEHTNSSNHCTVTERFFPTPSSIRWEIEILGAGRPWTTPIETQMAWLDPRNAVFWTAWDAPTPARPKTKTNALIDASEPGNSYEPWIDPLVPAPFINRNFSFGGLGVEGNVFSVPLASILNTRQDVALSLVQSPEDILLDMSMITSVFGDVILSRRNHRIASDKPVRFAMDLITHPADWRPALGWMASRYPDFFESPNSNAKSLDGCGAYSAYEGPLDVRRLKEWAFSANWNAHFDFPFLGMSIPPVKKGVQWKSWYQKPTSLGKMERYAASMKQSGFHVLEYFNVTECGNYIQESPPPQREADPADFWRDPNDFVYRVIPEAILRDANGKIIYSNWFKNVVVDPADPAWQKSLLEQVRTLVRELPDSSGICIDRMDWLRIYNLHADDGYSWIDGKPARFLANSWKETVGKLSSILKPAGKVIYGNPLIRRVDTAKWLDGFYDEYGDHARMLNLTAFMAVYKPAIGWTRTIDTLRPDPDLLFQRHLHLGVFPTVPFPKADHTIAPDPWVDRYYSDYGPLLNAIRGKRWILKPNVIQCDDGDACVNLFEVPNGYVVPLTFAKNDAIKVTIRHPEIFRKRISTFSILYPGGVSSQSNAIVRDGDVVRITVPVKRRCALVQIPKLA